MAAKLHFSLVSPERELYAGDVDQVLPAIRDAPAWAENARDYAAVRD